MAVGKLGDVRGSLPPLAENQCDTAVLGAPRRSPSCGADSRTTGKQLEANAQLACAKQLPVNGASRRVPSCGGDSRIMTRPRLEEIGTKTQTARRRSHSCGATERTTERSLVQSADAQPSCSKLHALPAVLFLDVDGVLHPTTVRHPRQQFQASSMGLLREILQSTGARIVLSTAWRLDPAARREVAEQLKAHGIQPFVSRTPNIQQFHRAKEILSWVRKHRPLAWVAIDDWPLFEENLSELKGHFVQTRPRFGLSPDTANQVIELFRAQMD